MLSGEKYLSKIKDLSKITGKIKKRQSKIKVFIDWNYFRITK